MEFFGSKALLHVDHCKPLRCWWMDHEIWYLNVHDKLQSQTLLGECHNLLILSSIIDYICWLLLFLSTFDHSWIIHKCEHLRLNWEINVVISKSGLLDCHNSFKKLSSTLTQVRGYFLNSHLGNLCNIDGWSYNISHVLITFLT